MQRINETTGDISMKRIWLIIPLFFSSLTWASLLDPAGDPPEPTETSLVQALDDTIFESPEKCSDWIFNHFTFVKEYSFWQWFQRFSITYKESSVKCDEDSRQCFASFYTNYRGQPEGGGCDLVGTPFWPEVQALLKDEIRLYEEKGESLKPEYFGMQCRYSKGQSPFQGECELTRRAHQSILEEEKKRKVRREALKVPDRRFNRNFIFY